MLYALNDIDELYCGSMSITNTFLSIEAKAVAKLTTVVVFPTPPFLIGYGNNHFIPMIIIFDSLEVILGCVIQKYFCVLIVSSSVK